MTYIPVGRKDPANDREHEAEAEFSHRLGGITRHVGNPDAKPRRCFHVDIIVTRGPNGNQLQIGKALQGLGVDLRPTGNQNLGAFRPGEDPSGRVGTPGKITTSPYCLSRSSWAGVMVTSSRITIFIGMIPEKQGWADSRRPAVRDQNDPGENAPRRSPRLAARSQICGTQEQRCLPG